MSRWRFEVGLVVAAVLGLAATAMAADEPTPAQRGEKALKTRNFTPPTFTTNSYQNLWKVWGLKEAPADMHKAVRERYGFHEAPFDNKGYPLGLREASMLVTKGVATDCMVCHGGSIAGKSYVGLGNSTFDFQQFTEDVAVAMGLNFKPKFTYTNVRGTVEAGAFTVSLMSLRNPDLSLRAEPLDLKLHDDLCEDTPAWWLLKKKKTMYYTGGGHSQSVRSLMQFMLNPLNTRTTFEKEEPTFRDIQAYLLSLEPPKYPWKIDQDLATKGQQLFVQNCARCHGTYGERWTYPNKIIPLKDIGTDARRFEGLSEEFSRHYNKTWFAQEKGGWFADEYLGVYNNGYQAPPLDGIWATAPYFHNGCAPTVYHVLNSKARPKIFTRSFKTDEADYDKEKLGWKVTVLENGPEDKAPPSEKRKVYDTTKPGRSNGGHVYGDDLEDSERLAIIEYLKTL